MDHKAELFVLGRIGQVGCGAPVNLSILRQDGQISLKKGIHNARKGDQQIGPQGGGVAAVAAVEYFRPGKACHNAGDGSAVNVIAYNAVAEKHDTGIGEIRIILRLVSQLLDEILQGPGQGRGVFPGDQVFMGPVAVSHNGPGNGGGHKPLLLIVGGICDKPFLGGKKIEGGVDIKGGHVRQCGQEVTVCLFLLLISGF